MKRLVRFRNSDLHLYFRRVASDSRCPTGAECATGGSAAVMLDGRVWKGPRERFDVRLPESADSVIWQPYDGYRIRLVKLEPYPAAGRRVKPSTYVATFIVKQL